MSNTTRRTSDRLSWFKMDAGAFLLDTSGLSMTHAGIYARLLAIYWTEEGKLPSNPQTLQRKVGVTSSEEERALEEVLCEFFPEKHHEHLDLQRDEVLEYGREQSERAKKRYAKPATQKPQIRHSDDPPEDF